MKSTQIFSSPFLGGLSPWLAHPVGALLVMLLVFGFDVSWAPGQTVVVEAATDLAAPVWSPVQTLTLTGDSIPFNDPQGALQPVRFYRLRIP